MTKTIIILAIFLFCGIWAGQHVKTVWHIIDAAINDEQVLYIADDAKQEKELSKAPPTNIQWSQLLPDEEKQVLSQYQQNVPDNLTDQVVLSLQASTDKNYQATLQSTNTVVTFVDENISISGFIVPIDVQENRTMTSFFLVPYFGACIHYPPPPPNQLIYVTIADGMPITEFQTPYRVSGVLKKDLYEDPLGTSAYSMDLLSIKEFNGEPDNFRSH